MSYGGFEFNTENAGYEGTDPMITSPAAGGGQKEKKARKPTEEQFMIPITIRQALKSLTPDGQCLIDGRDPHHVKLVACIKDVDHAATAISYNVEDGTGLINVKEWINNVGGPGEGTTNLDAQMYVRIIGKLQSFQGQVSITAYQVKLVSTPNELTHHMLECIYAREMATRRGGGAVATSAALMNNVGFGPQTTGMALDLNNGGSSSAPGFQQVSDYIQKYSEDNEIGIGRSQIVQAMQAAGVPEKAVTLAIDQLAGDGMIYSTTDEDTFKYAL